MHRRALDNNPDDHAASCDTADTTGQAGDREFTFADRQCVAEVLRRLLDEMNDSYSTVAMFAPHAEIVVMILTDQRISDALADKF
jgi:hypothetical protein